LIIAGQNKVMNGHRLDIFLKDMHPFMTAYLIVLFDDNSSRVIYDKNTRLGSSISMHGNNISVFTNSLPDNTKKIVLSVSIDATDGFNTINPPSLSIKTNNNDEYLTSNTSLKEKSLILLEVYKYKNTWKYKALSSGFVSGKEALLNSFNAFLEPYQEKTAKIKYSDDTIQIQKRTKVKKSENNSGGGSYHCM